MGYSIKKLVNAKEKLEKKFELAKTEKEKFDICGRICSVNKATVYQQTETVNIANREKNKQKINSIGEK